MKIMKGAFIIMTSIIAQLSSADARQNPVEYFRTDGEISRAQSGWTYAAGAGTNTVYLPFEGNYPDKGGRLQSPVFPLNKGADRPGYYRLKFKALSVEHGYWWLDYFDQNGRMLPDCNSAVYPGNDCRNYDEVVYVPGAARKMRIAFVSKGKVQASDVRFTTATAEEAARWCDEVYKILPPLKFSAPPDSMKLLPKTAAALKNGATWKVVMLGDSIVNDSFNSLFQALVKRDYPESRFEFSISVRGSTGCAFYRNPEEFTKFVAAYKPDLLMIGGISNFREFNAAETEALAEVITMAREQVGCEVLVMSQPLSADWRNKAGGALDWRKLMDQPECRGRLNFIPARDCAQKLNAAFWDMTAPCHDYLASAGGHDFNRDVVHNNDSGKQIIGRVLRQYMLTAK